MTRDEQRAEARAELQQFDWPRFDAVLIGGMGDGTIVEEVRRCTDLPLFVLEPRDEFREAWQGMDGVQVFDRIEPLRTALTSVAKDGASYLTLEVDWWGDEWFQPYKQEFYLAARRTHSMQVTGSNTALRMSRAWMDRFLDALPKMVGRPTANQMVGALKNIPAVIVGAGPSLDRNIADLKALQGKAAIVACNTALRPLHKHGITPDFVAIAEAKDVRPQLEGLPIKKMALLAGAHIDPRVYDLPWRAIYPVIGAHGSWARWFCEAIGTHPTASGGTVTTVAYGAMVRMGCSPVVLMGQDCAFADGGVAYCSDSTHSDANVEFDGNVATLNLSKTAIELGKSLKQSRPVVQGEAREVEAWGGNGTVRTMAMFDDFRGWFEQSAYELRERVRVINATEGGARMQGVEEMRLAEVAEVLPALPVPVAYMMDKANTPRRRVGPVEVIDALKQQRRAARGAGNRASRAADLSRRLQKADAAFREHVPSAHLFDSWVGARIKDIREAQGEEYANPMSRTIAIYEAATSAVDEIEPRIDALIAEVKDAL